MLVMLLPLLRRNKTKPIPNSGEGKIGEVKNRAACKTSFDVTLITPLNPKADCSQQKTFGYILHVQYTLRMCTIYFYITSPIPMLLFKMLNVLSGFLFLPIFLPF